MTMTYTMIMKESLSENQILLEEGHLCSFKIFKFKNWKMIEWALNNQIMILINNFTPENH